MAERVRFELTEAINLDGFQDRCLKPLGHLSKKASFHNMAWLEAWFQIRYKQERYNLPLLKSERTLNPPKVELVPEVRFERTTYGLQSRRSPN